LPSGRPSASESGSSSRRSPGGGPGDWDAFLRAITVSGNSWTDDRERVIAVGHHLGHRAVHHAGDKRSIDLECATKASAEIEAGCRMSRLPQGA
jgi:hypothetical protein